MTSFLAVGHVSRDELPDGAWRLGGSALYGAATAVRLGLAARLVTRVGPHERADLERLCADLGVDLLALPSLTTTTFTHRWDERGRRHLRLRSRARAIGAADVPADPAADVTLLGTIAHDVRPDLYGGGGVRVLAAQGLLRRWDADGTVRPAPWPDAVPHSRGLSAVVLSEEDVDGDAAVREWSRAAPVVMTLADRGARIYRDGEAEADAAGFRPASVVDPTGAGDAFAAALAVALAEGRELHAAVAFANAAASFCVEGPGTSGLAPRAEVDRRLAGLG